MAITGAVMDGEVPGEVVALPQGSQFTVFSGGGVGDAVGTAVVGARVRKFRAPPEPEPVVPVSEISSGGM